MSPKPFSLHSILKFRKRAEDLAHEQFLRTQLAENKAAEILECANKDLEALINELETKQISGMIIEELSRYEERIQYQRSHIKELRNIHTEKKKASQNKRLKLLKKVKEHKTLTALKERQDKSWKEYINKKEAAMLDEIAILHHDRDIN